MKAPIRLATILLITGLLITGLATAAAPLLATGTDDPAIAVRQVVMDIISFTRWPGPPPALRLCVIGQAEFAGPLFAPDVRVGPVPVTSRRRAAGDSDLGAQCDVVYEGPLPANERTEVIRNITGYPVLTIGESAPGCVETTMFCLKAGGAQVPFSTNLDAISRSGVRLNPRVLLLGRRESASAMPR
jgi:hypothetical protein